MAFVRLLRCAQIHPSLARLVQLIIHTVPEMGYFLTVFLLIGIGFALAFLLVFKTAHDTSRLEHEIITNEDDQLADLVFDDLPIALFQACQRMIRLCSAASMVVDHTILT